MIIPSERAFWLLEFYRVHHTQLTFGGRILSEEAACFASIVYVWPESRSIGISLMSDDGQQSWDRLIPLGNATFNWLQLGDDDFRPFEKSKFHSVLIVGFPDGTTMFLAEQATGDE
jgi:hypothetical protein